MQAWRASNGERMRGYGASYRQNMTPEQRAKDQAWREANHEQLKQYRADYRQARPGVGTEAMREWRAANRDRAKAWAREDSRKRRADPAGNLKSRMATRLRNMIKDKNGRATEELLGYTRHQLKAHIERQFTRGMSWEAMLRGEIHIDHIVPVSAFNITSVSDPGFRACWGLANLRPLWAADNIRKHSKRLHLI